MRKPSLRDRLVDKFAKANRAGVAPGIAPRDRRFIDAITGQLARANQANMREDGVVPGVSIPKRWTPVTARVARTPQAGFTPELLEAQRRRLRRIESAVPHGELVNVNVRRAAGEDVGAFLDLLADTRHSLHRLMSEPIGRELLTRLDARIGWNRVSIGDNADVFIGSTRPGDESNINAPHVQAGLEEGYRFDGVEGQGWGSEVRYNPYEPRAIRFIGLGHELVHAYRLAHGKAVGIPQLNQAGHALFNDPMSLGANVDRARNVAFGRHLLDVVQNVNHQREEFETVGLLTTPRSGTFQPSENALRSEHNLPLRRDYSRLTPATLYSAVDSVAPIFESRSLIAKIWQKVSRQQTAPTPVRALIDRYSR
ncbi:MAG TPA: M91 family zinc metallopeptidase [Dyella sp.]|uniref:M91 family zinc metallopeptidase n=1 Tax=Dyella sp. TaxID=1869338 RepID=UPI002F933DA9